MGKQEDLSMYNVRTDLAIELVKDGVNTREIDDILVTSITLDESQGKSIGKKKGSYVTIEFDDITDYENKEKMRTIFSKELKKLLQITNFNAFWKVWHGD